MADLVITAANVKKGTGAQTVEGVAGVAVTAGQLVYREEATGKFKLSDADSATPEVRAVFGVALHSAAVDQPLVVLKKGRYTVGATVGIGTAYIASATAGGVCPIADLATGMYPSLLGFAVTTTEIFVDIVSAGVAKA